MLALLTDDSAKSISSMFEQKRNVGVITAPVASIYDKRMCHVSVVRPLGDVIPIGVSAMYTPTINSDDTVSLDVELINTTITGRENIEGICAPFVHEQRYTAEVTIPNGATILFGSRSNDGKTEVAQLFKNLSNLAVEDGSKYELFWLVKVVIEGD